MAYGTESTLIIIDIVHKVCILHISVPAIYGTQDSRAPRSPKKTESSICGQDVPQARSPSIDQVSFTLCSFDSLNIYLQRV